MKKNILLTIIALSAVTISISAQKFRFPVDNTLSNPIVNCMTVDDEGYLWVGTRRGLNRFNGSNYLVYYETDIVDDKEVKRKACLFNISLISGHETSKDLITYMADSDKRYNRVSTYKTEVGDSWDMYDFKNNHIKIFTNIKLIFCNIAYNRNIMRATYGFSCYSHSFNINLSAS